MTTINLSHLAEKYILSLGGFISFNWSWERCGNTSWATLRGYVSDKSVKVVVTDGNRVEVNDILITNLPVS